MNAHDRTDFWDRYDREVRPLVEAACRRASRALSDGTMEPGDMASWVHTRVWRMLEKSAFPAFHDDPSVDLAVDRLTTHAPTLARWAYMALSRKHWRRLGRETPSEMDRVERLGATARSTAPLERREQIDDALARVRAALPDAVRQKLAASLPDKSERQRAALALGVTRPEDDRLIERVNAGAVRENTVQQMRSRARRHAAEALGSSIRLPLLALLAGVVAAGAPRAYAGEQSGGRGGTPVAAVATPHQGACFTQSLLSMGEQTGGRGGKG